MHESLQKSLLQVLEHVDIVIASRLSPSQKAEIVAMMRSLFPTKITMAVGDGANDVGMIMRSNIGVLIGS